MLKSTNISNYGYTSTSPFRGSGDGVVPYILSTTDYDPFGMIMNGRDWNPGEYRFAFNGKEKDDEVSGTGNQYDYGFRIYNSMIGKFLSVDPLFSSYPWNSTYAFAENDVIRSIDLEGAEKKIVIFDGQNTKTYTGSAMNFATPLLNQLKQQGLIHKNSTLTFTYLRIKEETSWGGGSWWTFGLKTNLSISYNLNFDGYDALGNSTNYSGEVEIPFGSVHHTGSNPIDWALTLIPGSLYAKFLAPVKNNPLIKGVGTLIGKSKDAMAGDLSALAEIKVAKWFLQQGKSIEFVAKKASEKTCDLIVNGLNIDIKRLETMKNFARNLTKGANQVGEGGQVIIVRPSNAGYTIGEAEDFIKGYQSPIKNVTFKVVEESSLPKAFGQ